MDQVKKFRIVFWSVFSLLILAIAFGSYYFFRLNNWKEDVIGSKDAKIAELQALLSDQGTSGSNALKEKEALVAENSKLNQEIITLSTESKDLKSKITAATAYNDFFAVLNSVIESHNGFTGWTDADFQRAKAAAEKTGSTAFVNTVNWAWYERAVSVEERVIRTWKETQSGIAKALE